MSHLDSQRLRRKAGEAARLLKLLANDRRLLILCRLLEGEVSVGQLTAAVGLSQSAVSQHLGRLRNAGIVATRRDGQTVLYRLASPVTEQVLSALAEVFCPPSVRRSPP